MTKKRPPAKKAPAKKRKGPPAAKKKKELRLLPALLIALLVAGVLTAGLYWFLGRPRQPSSGQAPTRPSPTSPAKIRPPASKRPAPQPNVPAGPHEPSLPPAAPIIPPDTERPKPEHRKPLVAIVIDDMGHSLNIGRKLIALDLQLTFAFLPYAANTRELMQQAHKRGRDILLHQPMEPSRAKWDPGPDSLYLNMSQEEMRSAFQRNLAAVPLAIGINNHMGSRFTQNWAGMEIFLREVKKEQLFFLDSFTSPNSVGSLLAARLDIRTAKRDIFLDNVQDKALIIKQLRALMTVAGNNGHAIAIGHPYQATLDALRDLKRELNTEVRLVGVHQLVH